MMRFLLLISVILLSFSGCYDSHSTPPTNDVTLTANLEIAELRRLCSNGCHTIAEDFICVGRVTTSDSEGNFYRSMFVEDASGGAEIRLGIYDIASQYPIGTQVALHLQNSAAILINGVVVVGLPPRSYDNEPREFEAQEVTDRHIVRGTSVEEIAPRLCNIAELNESLCGRFVEVTDVAHAPLEEVEELPVLEGYHRFADSEGNAIFTSVSEFADFATAEVPTEKITICGILHYESVGMSIGKQYVIKPRFRDDLTTAHSGDN